MEDSWVSQFVGEGLAKGLVARWVSVGQVLGRWGKDRFGNIIRMVWEGLG